MIRRSKHTTDYTVIPNQILEDQDLNCKGLGLLAYLIGKPENWNIRAEELGKRFGWGKTKVYSILKILMDAGYVTRKPVIKDGLKRGSEYTVYDVKPYCSHRRKMETPIVRQSERIISNKIITDNIKEKEIYKEKEFEIFKKEYPRSSLRQVWHGGSSIFKKFQSVLKKVEFETLMQGLREYKKDKSVLDGYAMNVKTWLNNEGWEYEPLKVKVEDYGQPLNNPDFILKEWNEDNKWHRGHLKRKHDDILRTLVKAGKIAKEDYLSA